jgi:hypothetical protein
VTLCSPLDVHQTTRRHVAEDSTLHSHRSNMFNDVMLTAALLNYSVSGSSVNDSSLESNGFETY